VALIALHRLYQRTCEDCGYRWTVTRAQKQRTVRAPVRVSTRRLSSSMATHEASVGAQEELIQPLKECAKFRGLRYSERPVTKRHPAELPD
jgi:hypothetical protein